MTDRSLVDQMCVDHNGTPPGLAEDLGEVRDRDGTGLNDVFEDTARPYRRELMNVSDHDDRCMQWDSLQKMVHQDSVDHGRFIKYQQIALEGLFLVTLKSAFVRTEFKEAMNSPGFVPCGLGHPLCSPAGRSGQQYIYSKPSEYLNHGIDYGGLACAGAAGDHYDLMFERKLDR